MTPVINPFALFFASIFTGNILLANFLGMCSFISISKDMKSSNGLGLAVTVVLTVTAGINWAVLQLLQILGLVYLRYIVFIIVIAAVVHLVTVSVSYSLSVSKCALCGKAATGPSPAEPRDCLIAQVIPLPAESDSFNAQPKAPAMQRRAVTPAGAFGWALNEQMSQSSPVEV